MRTMWHGKQSPCYWWDERAIGHGDVSHQIPTLTQAAHMIGYSSAYHFGLGTDDSSDPLSCSSSLTLLSHSISTPSTSILLLLDDSTSSVSSTSLPLDISIAAPPQDTVPAGGVGYSTTRHAFLPLEYDDESTGAASAMSSSGMSSLNRGSHTPSGSLHAIC